MACATHWIRANADEKSTNPQIDFGATPDMAPMMAAGEI
jgi:hypothetical protein